MEFHCIYQMNIRAGNGIVMEPDGNMRFLYREVICTYISGKDIYV